MVLVAILVVVGMIVSLLAPVPKRWEGLAARAAWWRRWYIRQRWRQRRPLLLCYLGLGAVAAAVLAIWVLPVVLTRHPQLETAVERHRAIADTRTGLVAMAAAVGAAAGLAYTARTYRLSREGQITDRYSKAVEQLGSDKLEVRLGGIYALERLMRDSPADQATIMETLAAYVREHAPVTRSPTERIGNRRVAGHHRVRHTPPLDHPTEDVQAVLSVLGRRRPTDTEGRINLQNTNLAGALLRSARLASAELSGTNLTGARLDGANLTDAFLGGADLSGAHLTAATMIRAHLNGAKLTGAWLSPAVLSGAVLHMEDGPYASLFHGPDLTNADLEGADLTNAALHAQTLAGAKLAEANLTGARVEPGSLSEYQLRWVRGADAIVWDEALPLPPEQL